AVFGRIIATLYLDALGLQPFPRCSITQIEMCKFPGPNAIAEIIAEIHRHRSATKAEAAAAAGDVGGHESPDGASCPAKADLCIDKQRRRAFLAVDPCLR